MSKRRYIIFKMFTPKKYHLIITISANFEFMWGAKKERKKKKKEKRKKKEKKRKKKNLAIESIHI